MHPRSPIFFDPDWSVWSDIDLLMIECMTRIGVGKVLWCDWEGVWAMVKKVTKREQ